MILDGKVVADKIKNRIKKKISFLVEKPILAVILVGDDSASKVYVNMKQIACGDVNIISKKFKYDEDVCESEIINQINRLNKDSSIHGILVQLPLPKHIDENKIIGLIDPIKDVDGFNPINIGNFTLGIDTLRPCTPKGIIALLDEYKIKIEGKDVVIVGRSNIVGRPLIQEFLQKNATITVCHSQTKDLASKTRLADILVVAVGRANLITKDMVKSGVVVVDVGVNRVEDKTKKRGYRLCGDVDFESIKEKAKSISPVPGGVGPMTVAMLLDNTLTAYKLQND